MFDHNFLTSSILNNNGRIVGSYVREWLANGNPSDFGWNDIDIKCPIDKIDIISKTIASKYPKLFLDFKATYFNSQTSIGLYSCNCITYDGNFRIDENVMKKKSPPDVSNWIDLTKNKKILFYHQFPIGRKFNFEKRMIQNGWTIDFLYLSELNNLIKVI